MSKRIRPSELEGRDTTESIDPVEARQQLEARARIHWYHWLIVTLSLMLTLFAWYYSKSALEARIRVQFDREADHVVELIQERMQKYEDALWGGVALIDASGGDVNCEHWGEYAESLCVERKYPGINGIGVIHALEKNQVPEYLAAQRSTRPKFRIHPAHEMNLAYPISYIIPVEGNEKAVGLDIAHEANRFSAARKSRDSGEARITGPITLVQDSSHTPGFLFYTPFYEGGQTVNAAERKSQFSGLVYAPFVVKKLMRGTLEKEKRSVGVRLVDAEEVLYDEHVSSEEDFDPNPLFQHTAEVPIYGRTWVFDIWSTNSFREASIDSQPLVILIGGILIDALLLILFVSISRSSRKALECAKSMTYQLETQAVDLKDSQQRLAVRASQLQESNADLEQFASVASHDLQEPLRKVSAFCQLLKEEYGEHLDEEANTYIDYAVSGAKRMKTLLSDLLTFSRASGDAKLAEPTSVAKALRIATENLEARIEESNAVIVTGELPFVMANQSQLVHLLQNLIGNGVKYRDPSRQPRITIDATLREKEWIVSVRDNGIGFGKQYFENIFEIFKRLHGRDEYSGTGIGLAICKRIVDGWGGKIWVESEVGVGSTFYFTIAKATDSNDRDSVLGLPASEQHDVAPMPLNAFD